MSGTSTGGFYKALKACGFESGRKGFTLYDTKKTAAGLLIDSGLSEREAMHFSGHATPSMFDRYIIKSAERHRENVRKRDGILSAGSQKRSRPRQKESDPPPSMTRTLPSHSQGS